MVNIKLKIDASGMIKKFGSIKAAMRNLERPLEEAGAIIVEGIRKDFEAGGRPPWTPLALATIEKKGHATILVDTGRLRSSIEARVSPGMVEVGPMTEPARYYAQFHQLGTDTIPKREFLNIKAEDWDRIEKIFDNFVRRAIGTRRF